MTRLTFLGAARTVTGSKYLLDTAGRQVLFDCGLFQGLRELRRRNWDSLPIVWWLSGFTRPPSTTFLVHGEPTAMTALQQTIEQRFQWTVRMSGYRESVDL